MGSHPSYNPPSMNINAGEDASGPTDFANNFIDEDDDLKRRIKHLEIAKSRKKLAGTDPHSWEYLTRMLEYQLLILDVAEAIVERGIALAGSNEARKTKLEACLQRAKNLKPTQTIDEIEKTLKGKNKDMIEELRETLEAQVRRAERLMNKARKRSEISLDLRALKAI